MVEKNYEKLKLEIDSIEQSLQSKITRMKDILNNMSSDITIQLKTNTELSEKSKSLEKTVSELRNKKESLNDQMNALTNEVISLKNDFSIDETSLNELKEKNSNLKTEKTSLNQEQDKLINDIKGHTDKISDEKVKLQHAEGLYSEKVASIEKEVNETKILASNKGTEYKVLEKLVKDKYVTISYYDVCKVMTQSGVDDLDRLVLSSGVDRNAVIETLNDLHARGIVTFEDSSGKFTILKEFSV